MPSELDPCHVQTTEKVFMISTKAVAEDVAIGLADPEGNMMNKRKIQPPILIDSDEVVRENESDPSSRLVEKGSFKNQIYCCPPLGTSVESMNKTLFSTVPGV